MSVYLPACENGRVGGGRAAVRARGDDGWSVACVSMCVFYRGTDKDDMMI